MADHNFYCESMVASKTGQPAVIFTIHEADFTTNMSVETARELALNLLQAAEAAEGDAFIFDFFHNHLSLTDQQALGLLVEFRNWRNKEEK